MMHDMEDRVKVLAAQVLVNIKTCKVGLVTGTRPDMQAVKVTLQPEDVQTGWLPVLSPMVGNGWGLVSHLSYGDQVVVLFQDGNLNCGIVIGALFSHAAQVPDSQSAPADLTGQFWLQHKSGSLFTFTNDGKVTLTSNGDLDINAGGNVNISGNVNVTGTLKATVDVQAGSEPVSLVNHLTTGVTPGSGVSGKPQ